MTDRYGRLRTAARCRETPDLPPTATELELQARFHRGDLGTVWTSRDGRLVELLHSGHWNREPGPDFRDARLLIDGAEVRGDIEIDLADRDWEAHGHGANPAFRSVVLHGYFQESARRVFTRDCDHREVPQVRLSADPATSDSRPLTPAPPLDESRAIELVEAAARHRLHRKAAAFRTAARLTDRADALFQALATGLGYRNNKIPFLLIAQRATLARSRAEGGEALLFGLAGFLDAETFDEGADDVRAYLAPLWEEWWRIRAREERLILPAAAWRLAGIRPANHPHRRLGALAAIVARFGEITRALDAGDCGAFAAILQTLRHRYWTAHWNLATSRLAGEIALIGEDRATDLAINAFIPAIPDEELAWQKLVSLPGPAPSGKLRQAAEWLSGGSLKPYRTAARQQGLLQTYDDFFPDPPETIYERLGRVG